MKINFKSKQFLLLILSAASACLTIYVFQSPQTSKTNGMPAASSKPKLYWFIPDGFRADRGQFNIFEWAQQGELPNLKKMLARGCYGYSWPVFPGHTPVNFATLMTGVSPAVHGVTDGSMRLLGYPLNMVAKGGFSSFAKLVPPLWVQAEKSGALVSLQSIPGSTPPELFKGNTIKGRWGAWGVDFPALVFQDKISPQLQAEIGQNKRLFTLGPPLTRFESSGPAKDWQLTNPQINASSAFEINLENWNAPLYALVYKANGAEYDHVLLSTDKKMALADLSVDQWSPWLPVTLHYELKNDYQLHSPKKSELERELSSIEVATFMKIKVIRLGNRGEFRIRIVYDNLNEFLTAPESLAEDMRAQVGHMVDFVDSYPPQLIYFPEDKKTFLEEAALSWDWHQNAVKYLVKNLKSDVVLHSIYSPNQMLTSRWWLPFIDSTSYRFAEKPPAEKAQLWSEVKTMYRQADKILGEILQQTDQNWYVVLSSDHGVVPLYKEVRLNNLFHKKGWLQYHFNKVLQEYEIDWAKTQVAYLQMNNIYIHPKGLAGIYQRGSSREYTALREQVRQVLQELEDPQTHQRPLSHSWNYEEAAQAGLRPDRVGDLIIANSGQYSWSEDVSPDDLLFAGTLKGGYKQGVWPQSIEGMLTPFVIMGPGIKAGCELKEPINHVDQFATISYLLGTKPDYPVEGRVLKEILDEPR